MAILTDDMYRDKGTLSAAAVNNMVRFNIPRSMTLRLISIQNRGAAATGNAVITFEKRPIAGSDAGKVTIGTVTLGALATGKKLNNILAPNTANKNLNEGDEVLARVTTADVSATDLVAYIEGDINDEYSVNEADVTVVTA